MAAPAIARHCRAARRAMGRSNPSCGLMTRHPSSRPAAKGRRCKKQHSPDENRSGDEGILSDRGIDEDRRECCGEPPRLREHAPYEDEIDCEGRCRPKRQRDGEGQQSERRDEQQEGGRIGEGHAVAVDEGDYGRLHLVQPRLIVGRCGIAGERELRGAPEADEVAVGRIGRVPEEFRDGDEDHEDGHRRADAFEAVERGSRARSPASKRLNSQAHSLARRSRQTWLRNAYPQGIRVRGRCSIES